MDEIAASGDESDEAFVVDVRAKFIGGCVDGDVDRKELECLRRAKNDTEHIRCVYGGEQRRQRRERKRL